MPMINTAAMVIRYFSPEEWRLVLVMIMATLALDLYRSFPILIEFSRYLRYMLDHEKHYKRAAATLKGKVLAWAVPGRPITFYLTDGAAMRKVFMPTPALDTKALADLLHWHAWQIPIGKPSIYAADKQVHLAMAKAKISGLVESFEKHFTREVERHRQMVGHDGRAMPLQTMGYRLIYRCVTPTVFGPDYPVEGTRVNNQIFAENVHYVNVSSMLPIFPPWIWNAIFPGARKAMKAKDRVRDLLEVWETNGGVETASENYKSIASVLNQGDLDADQKAKWLNTIQFGFLANTGEVVGWFLLYVSQSPRLLTKIKEEVDALPDGTSISTLDLKRLCPYLDSALHETLRMVAVVFAGRRLTQNVRLPGVERTLPKGSLVRTMTRAAAFDTSVWGDDAAYFRGDRFTGEEGAKLYREEMVFGGGGSQCPGRHFATHELQVVFATLIRNFEFGPIEFYQKPSYDASDATFGKPVQGKTAEIIDVGGQRLIIQHPGYAHQSGIEVISGLLQPNVEPVAIMRIRK